MPDFREQYEKAQQLGKLAFIDRPLFGSPAAPAQAETNASQIWGHINAGYLIAHEYTRWWKESQALRQAAVVGDWSWLNKTRVHVKDARRVAPDSNAWQLVLLGEGEVPVREQLQALRQYGYEGYVSVEWEKKWRPELAGPEVAIPHFAEWFRQLQ